ncbi:NAD(P)/FAD-dependent oxidoreductase [Brevundimonas staleyi]|uniref:NAD(P)/FAD-dependent oxidoreductase n=1 Tax=Brevundimonas staleyi TaxID=74326 RepID=A0ABW0FTF4_9CAUL
MTVPDRGVVIIGAGHAGGTAAAFLRQYGYEAPIALVGDEPLIPYQRPPLSKAWLKGEADGDSLALRPQDFYDEQGIELRLSVSATAIDRTNHAVLLSDGSSLPYEHLILATGARARMLEVPGADLVGVHVLRTAADAEAIKAQLGEGRTLAVVGGGYVGLEVAASARALGSEVVVLEREPRLLARVACDVLSTFFQTYHEDRGVRFELAADVVGFAGNGPQVSGVILADGRTIPCDAAVVGVGAIPNDDLAVEAGLEVQGGVLVDLEARTSDPAIFAIGDVTRRPMPIYDRLFRMESVPNALEQAKQAASAITGRPAPTGETPWQWSDQYDLKLQIAGYPFDADRIVVRGDPADASFAVFHLSGDKVQAVEAINAPPEFMMGKKLIGERRAVDVAKLADKAVSMKEVGV